MLYPENLEEKIGFNKIRDLIGSYCLCGLGHHYLEKMRFGSSPAYISKLIEQTYEFKRILELNEPFPQQNYVNALPFLEKARLQGTYLDEEEFYQLYISLQTIIRCLDFLRQHQTDYPELASMAENVQINGYLLEQLNRILDDNGRVRDNASPELANIRAKITSESVRARRTLESILKMAVEKGYTPDDVSLTLRGGRMVIPVKATYKRQVKGFIHDESATGQTVYLEPAEVFEANNEIRDLELQERREILRILTKLTDSLRPELDSLRKGYLLLGQLDFIRAKAKFAIQLKANRPVAVTEARLNLVNARHPLLELTFQKSGKKIVPLNISLDDDQRIIIISGPNAGGKSVALTSLGLIQYMFQCGLLIPAEDHSTIGVFKDIFIDIGDEQSIENDLSTYSSHLQNMRHFTEFSGGKTLFLIDEFGSGTEPLSGGAIAEAILEALYAKKAFGVITTHYSNLKKFAESHPGVSNAAMRFDVDKLEPLYALETGKPGSSFALEIARKIGLSKKVLLSSLEKIGQDQVKFEKLTARLEQDKKELEDRLAEVMQRENQLNRELDKYRELNEFLKAERKKILNQAKTEAKELLKTTNQKIEQTIREIRENKAEKEVTQQIRKSLDTFKDSIKAEPAETGGGNEEEVEVVGGKLNPGDWARIKGQETLVEVMEIRAREAEIRMGALKSYLKLNRLEKVTRKEARRAQLEERAPARMEGLDINQKMVDFSSNLDIRGRRGEEAMVELQNFLDQALLLGQNELRIIHGKGDGILRDLIRNQLRQMPHVRQFRDEHVERGGAGVTLVELG